MLMLGLSAAGTGSTGMFADAEAYERFMGRWSRLLAPMLVTFAGVPDSGQILDVGSGTGVLAFSLARQKPHCRVVGIDPSKEYVAYARSRNPLGARVRFDIGDAQQLHFANATFQSSLSLLVFNFIPDPRKALREVIRVTKPGGRIAAAVWDYGEGMRMLRVFWDSAVSIDPRAETLDERHMPLCRAGDLSALWRGAGLTSVEEGPLNLTMRFSSFDDYWSPFLLAQGPAGAYIRSADAARVKLIRTQVQQLLRPASAEGPFHLNARAWAVRGTVPPSSS